MSLTNVLGLLPRRRVRRVVVSHEYVGDTLRVDDRARH